MGRKRALPQKRHSSQQNRTRSGRWLWENYNWQAVKKGVPFCCCCSCCCCSRFSCSLSCCRINCSLRFARVVIAAFLTSVCELQHKNSKNQLSAKKIGKWTQLTAGVQDKTSENEIVALLGAVTLFCARQGQGEFIGLETKSYTVSFDFGKQATTWTRKRKLHAGA